MFLIKEFYMKKVFSFFDPIKKKISSNRIIRESGYFSHQTKLCRTSWSILANQLQNKCSRTNFSPYLLRAQRALSYIPTLKGLFVVLLSKKLFTLAHYSPCFIFSLSQNRISRIINETHRLLWPLFCRGVKPIHLGIFGLP